MEKHHTFGDACYVAVIGYLVIFGIEAIGKIILSFKNDKESEEK